MVLCKQISVVLQSLNVNISVIDWDTMIHNYGWMRNNTNFVSAFLLFVNEVLSSKWNFVCSLLQIV